MSTITSCTLLSGRPMAMPANSTGARLQSARPTAVALPSFQRKCRSLSVCRAVNPKAPQGNPKMEVHAFNIPSEVLVNLSPQSEGPWRLEEMYDVKEETEIVNLEFDVPGLSMEDLVVEIDEDVLVVKKKEKKTEKASVYARLFVPSGYNREKVKANLHSGVLKVSIAKVKSSARRKIPVEIKDNPDIE